MIKKRKKKKKPSILTSVSNRVFDKGNSLIAKYVWHSKIRDEERPAIDPPNWVVFSAKGCNVEKESLRSAEQVFREGEKR